MSEIYAVAGGKGGVGKSVVSIMLAKAFSMEGKKTVLVDADLGGANLHTLLGMEFPRYGLVDFISKRSEKLDDILMRTPDKNVSLISGAGEVLGMANLKWAVKKKLISHIKRIDSEKIVIDLGAGSSFSVLDIFLYAGRHLLVLSPEPTSLQNLNEFMKFCVARLLYLRFSKNEKVKSFLDRFVIPNRRNAIATLGELLNKVSSRSKGMANEIRETLQLFQPYIVVNMANDPAEAERYFKAVHLMARQYLKVEVRHLCTVLKGEELQKSIKKNQSLLSLDAGLDRNSIVDIQRVLGNGKFH